jgi:predicted metal-dependent hydrolase
MTDRARHDYQLYLEGLRLFNAGAYYESHEVWEDLWLRNRSEARPFLQGLIQVAAALHHQARGNAVGMQALLVEAGQRLRPFAPATLGVAVEPLLADLAELQLERKVSARLEYTTPDFEAFAPHAGSVPGPAVKQDWRWQAAR